MKLDINKSFIKIPTEILQGRTAIPSQIRNLVGMTSGTNNNEKDFIVYWSIKSGSIFVEIDKRQK